MIHLAVDIANYAGQLKPETVAAWKAAGVERVIVRASTEDDEKIAIATQQMQAIVDGGLQLHAYEWLYFDQNDPPEEQTNRVVETFGHFPINRIWIDCEDKKPFPLQLTLEWIWWSMTIAGWAYGIYTGPWWWHHYTGDTTFFRGTPIWLAGETISTLLEGNAAMVQLGSMDLGGVNVDLNLYRE